MNNYHSHLTPSASLARPGTKAWAALLATLAIAVPASQLSAQTTYYWRGSSGGGGNFSQSNFTTSPTGTLDDRLAYAGTEAAPNIVSFGHAVLLDPFRTTATANAVVNLLQLQFGSVTDASNVSFTINSSGSGALSFRPLSGVNPSIVMDSARNHTISAPWNLQAPLTVSGTGTGALTFNGAFTSNGHAITMTGTSTLILARTATTALAVPLNLNGGVVQLNTTGAIGNSGTISFGGGTLRHTSGNTVDYSGRFSTGDNQQYNIDTNGQNVTWAGALISNGGTLTKNGAGILTLNGTNTFTGQVTVNGGTLTLGNGNAFPSGSPLALNGGVFNLNGNNASVGALSGTSNITLGAGNLTSTSNSDSSYSGIISGTGRLTKAGSGVLALSGANTYSGGTTLSGGTLHLGSSGAIGSSGTISFGGGTLRHSASNTTDYSSRFSAAAGQQYNIDTNGQSVTWASNLQSSGGSLTKNGAGTLTLTGNNTYSGVTNVNAGTLTFGSATAFSSNTTLNVANGATVNFWNNTIPGGRSVSYNGNYTGNLTVAALSTWSGNNTISGNLEVFGTLSPGNSPGTQTVDGNTFFFGGGSYNWEIADANGDAGVGYDTLVTGGTLNLSNLSSLSQFTINVISLSSIAPDVFGPADGFDPAGSFSWTIATAGTINGFNANHFIINTSGFQNAFSGSFSLSVINNGATQELVLSYIPEPSAFAALAGVAALGLAATRRRRRA